VAAGVVAKTATNTGLLTQFLASALWWAQRKTPGVEMISTPALQWSQHTPLRNKNSDIRHSPET
jgi:hypothetical protein